MIVIENLNEFIGRNNIVSVNQNEYFYEFNLENGNKLIIHKNLTGDKCIIETDGNALLIDPKDLSDMESILNSLNKL